MSRHTPGLWFPHLKWTQLHLQGCGEAWLAQEASQPEWTSSGSIPKAGPLLGDRGGPNGLSPSQGTTRTSHPTIQSTTGGCLQQGHTGAMLPVRQPSTAPASHLRNGMQAACHSRSLLPASK